MNFNLIKANFEKGLWTKEMVGMAVAKGVITALQYREITGQKYN